MRPVLSYSGDHYKVRKSILKPRKLGNDPIFVIGSDGREFMVRRLDSEKTFYLSPKDLEKGWSLGAPLPGYVNLEEGVGLVCRSLVNSYRYGLHESNTKIVSFQGERIDFYSLLSPGGVCFFKQEYPSLDFLLEHRASGAISRYFALDFKSEYPSLFASGICIGRLKENVVEIHPQYCASIPFISKVVESIGRVGKLTITTDPTALEGDEPDEL